MVVGRARRINNTPRPLINVVCLSSVPTRLVLRQHPALAIFTCLLVVALKSRVLAAVAHAKKQTTRQKGGRRSRASE
jgi:hypothetical protein